MRSEAHSIYLIYLIIILCPVPKDSKSAYESSDCENIVEMN